MGRVRSLGSLPAKQPIPRSDHRAGCEARLARRTEPAGQHKLHKELLRILEEGKVKRVWDGNTIRVLCVRQTETKDIAQ
jgi:hypothetical protein